MEYNMFLASDGNEMLRNKLKEYGAYAFYEYIERNSKFKAKMNALHGRNSKQPVRNAKNR